ncbi:transmembrane protein 253, partial [Conger conger]|uniref:transmembrane protein 253 n=1 Tax=Conger conger TaxID=82655 RepID=UPI002A59B4B2
VTCYATGDSLRFSKVVQVLGALASVLTTISFICMEFGCSISMTTPIWCGVFYLATGGLSIHVQRKPNRLKVSTLMGLNIFSLLLGLLSILTYSLHIAKEDILLSKAQRVGAYVTKGSSMFFMVMCLLASVYTLLLIWRGLSHNSTPYRQTYSALSQGGEEQSDLLLTEDSL